VNDRSWQQNGAIESMNPVCCEQDVRVGQMESVVGAQQPVNVPAVPPIDVDEDTLATSTSVKQGTAASAASAGRRK